MSWPPRRDNGKCDIRRDGVYRQLSQMHRDGDTARLQQRAARLVEIATAALNASAASRSAASGGSDDNINEASVNIARIDHHRNKIGGGND